jgi:hypothetical protein
MFAEEDGSDLAAQPWDGCDAPVAGRLAYPEVRAALAPWSTARSTWPVMRSADTIKYRGLNGPPSSPLSIVTRAKRSLSTPHLAMRSSGWPPELLTLAARKDDRISPVASRRHRVGSAQRRR